MTNDDDNGRDTGPIDPPTFDDDMAVPTPRSGFEPTAPRMREAQTRLERPTQPHVDDLARTIPRREVPEQVRAISMKTPATPAPEVRAISMKTPADPAPEKAPRQRPQVKLAASSSSASRSRVAPPVGNLAPPLDPREARSRKLRDMVMWASLVVILASIVTLVIWLIAGR
jgi:hypothetical protein